MRMVLLAIYAPRLACVCAMYACLQCASWAPLFTPSRFTVVPLIHSKRDWRRTTVTHKSSQRDLPLIMFLRHWRRESRPNQFRETHHIGMMIGYNNEIATWSFDITAIIIFSIFSDSFAVSLVGFSLFAFLKLKMIWCAAALMYRNFGYLKCWIFRVDV
jgi:hypothetical protein